jgi:hypothetical protein
MLVDYPPEVGPTRRPLKIAVIVPARVIEDSRHVRRTRRQRPALYTLTRADAESVCESPTRDRVLQPARRAIAISAYDDAGRRPGAFLASALVAGFVVERLGKGVATADPAAGSDKPDSDSFVSSPTQAADQAETLSRWHDTGSTGYAGLPNDAGYAVGTPVATEYAATGTGTPLAVDEEYVLDDPATRP